ncbi:MAG: bifunctional diguanylate cyclase/phosphodiesterase, partial [Oceanospirillales bacterium]|nr:bifunctional diguanylate cyclase/phosphodiesterase [Oceanospirillales bacterium]
RFKSINDSLGHRTGDLLLKAVAGRIETLVTSSDRAARFGGDEFVLMLIGRLGRSDLESVVIRLRDGLSAPYQLEDKRVHVSPSIGIAWTDGRERDLETLIRHADIAMYSAKRAGRGQYRYFQRSESEHRTEEFELEQGLQAALKHNEFELVYQPIVDLVSERLLGLEALVRWRHPQRGVLPAERFIPVAERAGLMSELGIEILRIAMRQMSRWRQAGVDCMPVSVDVSPQQLQHNGFSECVLELLDNLSIDGAELRLEVSESAILGTNTQVYDQLEQLSQAGIGITLDHFGRGYAGFAQLQRLPFSTVKLDRKLVGEIRRSDEDPAILSATIALARKLSLEVVAEGVETLEQLACLQRLGCNRGQGALLYPPLVCDEITPLLQSQIDRRDT